IAESDEYEVFARNLLMRLLRKLDLHLNWNLSSRLSKLQRESGQMLVMSAGLALVRCALVLVEGVASPLPQVWPNARRILDVVSPMPTPEPTGHVPHESIEVYFFVKHLEIEKYKHNVTNK
ncbi:unnamed protein product, partial [Owenia fusiformis]